jgi:hypothetical protein
MFCTQLFTCHPSESSRLNLFCSCTHLPLPGATKNGQSFLSGQHSYSKWTIYNPLTLDLPIKIVIFPVRYVSLREFTTPGRSKNSWAVAEDMINPRVGQPQLWPHKAPQTLPIQSVDWVGRIHPSLLKLIISQFAILLGSPLSMGILRVTSVLCHSGP